MTMENPDCSCIGTITPAPEAVVPQQRFIGERK